MNFGEVDALGYVSVLTLIPRLWPAGFSLNGAVEITIDSIVMRKVWVYKRSGAKGWWTGWYEGGKRKAKALPTKELAEHFCRIKYTQLNCDVFTGAIPADWNQMTEEYRHCKEVAGVVQASLYESALTLRHFERIVGTCKSRQITQEAVDRFILERGKEVQRSTLNKDIRNLKTFINWCRQNRYVNGEVKLRLLKEP